MSRIAERIEQALSLVQSALGEGAGLQDNVKRGTRLLRERLAKRLDLVTREEYDALKTQVMTLQRHVFSQDVGGGAHESTTTRHVNRQNVNATQKTSGRKATAARTKTHKKR